MMLKSLNLRLQPAISTVEPRPAPELARSATRLQISSWRVHLSASWPLTQFTLAFQNQRRHSVPVTAVNRRYDVPMAAAPIFLANSVQYSDFNGKDERSWQARYDLNMASYGVPGLDFMARLRDRRRTSAPTLAKAKNTSSTSKANT